MSDDFVADEEMMIVPDSGVNTLSGLRVMAVKSQRLVARLVGQQQRNQRQGGH